MSKRMDELAKRSRFRIGDIEVHPDRCAIIKDGKEIDLGQLTMLLLVVLAENNGKVVSRKELLIKVWKNEELDDNPIYKEILELRDKLSDDRSAPRYIKTVRGDGYRTVAPVVFPENYRPLRRQDRTWFKGSPYVGLAAFDETHADVFFGRERMREKVLQAMRAQFETGSRFVLLHGASGSGKTSLLHAGVIPGLKRPASEEDLRALAVAHCDLASAQPGDVLGALAAALATWTLGDCPVFPPQPLEDLKNVLIERPESIEHIIDEAFRLHTDRKAAEHPLAHLLLVIDHGEKLVDATPVDALLYEQFSRALTALCDSERTLTAMIVRGDFYQRLQDALPELMELKGSQGHIDVVRPSPREIEEIISAPAECAGLFFENDPETGDDLDYRLREDARGKPDVLPLLQHTMQQLYKKRDKKKKLLTFSAYHAMGGLEGGIAHRTEEVFAKLSPEVQASLDEVLTQLIVVQPDTGAVSGRFTFLDSLDANAHSLIQAFVSARLFASEQGENRPRFGVAHEALLRQWPRAVDWAKENYRLLQARAHFKIAADRWNKESRSPDHLLNPGRQLIDATDAAKKLHSDLENYELDFLRASTKSFSRRRVLRRSAIATLTILTAISITMASIAQVARQNASSRQLQTQDLTNFIIQELAGNINPTGNIELLESISKKIILHYQARGDEDLSISDLLNYSRALRTLGLVRSSQGFAKEAATLYALSIEKAGNAVDIDNQNGDAWFEMCQSIHYLGELKFTSKEYDGADKKWRHYLRIAEKFAPESSTDAEWLMEKSYALNDLGSSALRRGKVDIALDNFMKSTAIKEKIFNLDKNNLEHKYAWIDSKSWTNSALEAKGNFTEASRGYDEAINELGDLIAKKESANTWKFRRANYFFLSATVKIKIEDFEKAERDANSGVKILTELTRIEPQNSKWAERLFRGKGLLQEIKLMEASNRVLGSSR